ncbi:MAG: hypothetical protein K1000chlam2_00107 [Chlamydiae bacterium]|nr:hypothetical protein [Chlamydiota bacterium]
MNIAFRSRFLPLEDLFSLAQGVVGIGALCVFIFFVVALCRSKEYGVDFSVERDGRTFEIDAILTGPLGLRENVRSPLAIALEQKLVLLAQSVRPDLEKQERAFCIGVKGSEQQAVVREGEAIFCHLTQHASGGVEALEFADGVADISMIPHIVTGNSLLLKVEQKAGEMMEVVLKAAAQVRNHQGISEGACLEGAKWWGTDLLFHEYGAEQYHQIGQKHKLELVEGKEHYVLYVAAKDFLTYQGGKWQVIDSLEDAVREAPLAQIQSIGPRELDIEAWDPEGFSLFQTKLHPETLQAIRMVPGQVISEAKLRSRQQVSCKIGKKRWILKPGDWLIKTQTNWHKLKTGEEIENFLDHQLRGELFVIDSIDATGMIKGHYFDEMRTQMQPFSLKAASSKGRKSVRARI